MNDDLYWSEVANWLIDTYRWSRRKITAKINKFKKQMVSELQEIYAIEPFVVANEIASTQD